LPAEVEGIEVEGPGGVEGCGGVGFFDAAAEIDGAVEDGAAEVGAGLGEGREVVDLEGVTIQGEAEDLVVVAGGVAAADADQSLGGGDGDAVGGGAGESAEGAPGGVGVVEDVDGVVPDFGAAFPGFFVGEIGSAGDDEAVVVKASEGGGEADGIWEIG
jgi:hypothetical protein